MVKKQKTRRVHFTENELSNLVKNSERTCVSVSRSKRVLYLHPFQLRSLRFGVRDALQEILYKYDSGSDGILLAYRKAEVQSPVTSIIADQSLAQIVVTANFYVFKPFIGCRILGTVLEDSKDLIGCLALRCFNVACPKEAHTSKKGAAPRVFVGQEVLLEITELNLHPELPYIRGRILKLPQLQPEVHSEESDSGIGGRDTSSDQEDTMKRLAGSEHQLGKKKKKLDASSEKLCKKPPLDIVFQKSKKNISFSSVFPQSQSTPVNPNNESLICISKTGEVLKLLSDTELSKRELEMSKSYDAKLRPKKSKLSLKSKHNKSKDFIFDSDSDAFEPCRQQPDSDYDAFDTSKRKTTGLAKIFKNIPTSFSSEYDSENGQSPKKSSKKVATKKVVTKKSSPKISATSTQKSGLKLRKFVSDSSLDTYDSHIFSGTSTEKNSSEKAAPNTKVGTESSVDTYDTHIFSPTSTIKKSTLSLNVTDPGTKRRLVDAAAQTSQRVDSPPKVYSPQIIQSSQKNSVPPKESNSNKTVAKSPLKPSLPQKSAENPKGSNSDMFRSEDDEPEAKSPQKTISKIPSQKVQPKVSSSEDSSSEDEKSKAMSPAKHVAKPVTPQKVQPKVPSSEDSSSEDEKSKAKSPVKHVAKPVTPQKVQQKESSSEDSSSEDEKSKAKSLVKHVAKPVTPQKVQQKESSSEDSSSEDENPKVKSPTKPMAKPVTPQKSTAQSEESSDSETANEARKTHSQKPAAVQARKSSSDADSSEDEKPKSPVKSATPQKSALPKPSSSEDSDTDSGPVKVDAKSAATTSQKLVSEESSSEDDSVEKPKSPQKLLNPSAPKESSSESSQDEAPNTASSQIITNQVSNGEKLTTKSPQIGASPATTPQVTPVIPRTYLCSDSSDEESLPKPEFKLPPLPQRARSASSSSDSKGTSKTSTTEPKNTHKVKKLAPQPAAGAKPATISPSLPPVIPRTYLCSDSSSDEEPLSKPEFKLPPLPQRARSASSSSDSKGKSKISTTEPKNTSAGKKLAPQIASAKPATIPPTVIPRIYLCSDSSDEEPLPKPSLSSDSKGKSKISATELKNTPAVEYLKKLGTMVTAGMNAYDLLKEIQATVPKIGAERKKRVLTKKRASSRSSLSDHQSGNKVHNWLSKIENKEANSNELLIASLLANASSKTKLKSMRHGSRSATPEGIASKKRSTESLVDASKGKKSRLDSLQGKPIAVIDIEAEPTAPAPVKEKRNEPVVVETIVQKEALRESEVVVVETKKKHKKSRKEVERGVEKKASDAKVGSISLEKSKKETESAQVQATTAPPIVQPVVTIIPEKKHKKSRKEEVKAEAITVSSLLEEQKSKMMADVTLPVMEEKKVKETKKRAVSAEVSSVAPLVEEKTSKKSKKETVEISSDVPPLAEEKKPKKSKREEAAPVSSVAPLVEEKTSKKSKKETVEISTDVPPLAEEKKPKKSKREEAAPVSSVAPLVEEKKSKKETAEGPIVDGKTSKKSKKQAVPTEATTVAQKKSKKAAVEISTDIPPVIEEKTSKKSKKQAVPTEATAVTSLLGEKKSKIMPESEPVTPTVIDKKKTKKSRKEAVEISTDVPPIVEEKKHKKSKKEETVPVDTTTVIPLIKEKKNKKSKKAAVEISTDVPPVIEGKISKKSKREETVVEATTVIPLVKEKKSKKAAESTEVTPPVIEEKISKKSKKNAVQAEATTVAPEEKRSKKEGTPAAAVVEKKTKKSKKSADVPPIVEEEEKEVTSGQEKISKKSTKKEPVTDAPSEMKPKKSKKDSAETETTAVTEKKHKRPKNAECKTIDTQQLVADTRKLCQQFAEQSEPVSAPAKKKKKSKE